MDCLRVKQIAFALIRTWHPIHTRKAYCITHSGYAMNIGPVKNIKKKQYNLEKFYWNRSAESLHNCSNTPWPILCSSWWSIIILVAFGNCSRQLAEQECVSHDKVQQWWNKACPSILIRSHNATFEKKRGKNTSKWNNCFETPKTITM